jgi:serine/threonine protein kinase
MQIGDGGYGKVYAETLDGRPVAVKCYTHKEMLPCMIGEIVLLHTFQHPAVMPVITCRRSRGVQLVMPRGRAMHEYTPPSDEMPRLLHEVLQAIAYIHECGVIHGDIKGENVIIVDDHAKLSDFGGSLRMVGQAMWLVHSEELRAPEQNCDKTMCTPALDMWSFGQLITDELLYRYIKRSRPVQWSELAARCLLRDPESRITAAEALALPMFSEFARWDNLPPAFRQPRFFNEIAADDLAWFEHSSRRLGFHQETLRAAREIFARVTAFAPAGPHTRAAVLFIASSTVESADENKLVCITPEVAKTEDEVWRVLEALEFQILPGVDLVRIDE